MAKKKRKPRTPPPPRSAPRGASAARTVQAPQVRKKQKQHDPAARERQKRYAIFGTGGALAVGIVIALIVVFAAGGGTAKADLTVDYSKLPAVSHNPPPWPAEINNLQQRLSAMGLQILTVEGQAVHIHQHLSIFDNGKPVTVPQGIGIIPESSTNALFSPLHTHDPTGIMHVESNTKRNFSLGEFFGVWGVYLSRKCIGGLCQKPGTPLKFYVDGRPFRGNPVTMELKEHQVIAIVYGKPPKKIPSTYNFQVRGL
jgi:hypothetical protein